MDAELDGARLWWIASGLLLALELFSGTVFLLLLAIGLACAGLVAWGGGAVPLQMLTAALIGGGAMLALRTWRRRRRGDAPPDIGLALDRGQAVHVSRRRHRQRPVPRRALGRPLHRRHPGRTGPVHRRIHHRRCRGHDAARAPGNTPNACNTLNAKELVMDVLAPVIHRRPRSCTRCSSRSPPSARSAR